MGERARWLLSIAFVVVICSLLLGTWRASTAADAVELSVNAQKAEDNIVALEAAVEHLSSSLWRFEAQPKSENARHRLTLALQRSGQAVLGAEESLLELSRDPRTRKVIEGWSDVDGAPLLQRGAPLAVLRTKLGAISDAVGGMFEKTSGRKTEAFREAQDAYETLIADAHALAVHARGHSDSVAQYAEQQSNFVSRDLLVLFLLMAFVAPLGIVFGSRLITSPLGELRTLAKRIDAGRVRDLTIRGNDEVALVERAIRSALRRLEQNDARQRGKIFEMRRIIRALIEPVEDGIVVIGRGGKIDYANPAVAQLLGTEAHRLETSVVEEAFFCPRLTEMLEAAWTGDLDDKGDAVRIEAEDGRVAEVRAQLRTVRDRSGEVSRVVVVMHL